ncbi:hypothetical protein EZJ49_08850 [Bdellovibrio bacteriovorus]|uniref:hypothetical protein n=1 Tax=Bdellovibrio bacteriovorus TaxID=959 RepID=UPI0021D252A9|nr:hypothetical protein [Bdellovibrio bacteriovorus]UXR63184.1 hypothetical protein EZJ49_08850 [Bdellovibrio bacteriovorus]
MKAVLAVLITLCGSAAMASQFETSKKATEVLLAQAGSTLIKVHEGTSHSEKKLSVVLAEALIAADGSVSLSSTYCTGNSYDGTDDCTLSITSKNSEGKTQILKVSFETFRDKNGQPDALVTAPQAFLSK